MNRTIFALLTVASLTACSGSGTSTTDRDTATNGDTDASTTDDSASGTTNDSEAETTDTPTTDTPTTTEGSSGTSAVDETGDPTVGETGSTTGGVEDVTIVGNWLSDGDNVAPILVQLAGTVSIDATFDKTAYSVLTTDMDGQEVEFAGVYTVEASGVGNIMNITLEQSAPQTVTSQGIYEIDNSTNPPTMTYEVVQTVPDVGAQAPTADLGFGGTSFGADLTQVFVWQG